MSSFWHFFESCLDSVPDDLGSEENLMVEHLANPKRFRFFPLVLKQAGDDNAASRRVHAALRTLANMYNNWGDVANMADLQGFPELDTHVDVPSYVC